MASHLEENAASVSGRFFDVRQLDDSLGGSREISTSINEDLVVVTVVVVAAVVVVVVVGGEEKEEALSGVRARIVAHDAISNTAAQSEEEGDERGGVGGSIAQLAIPEQEVSGAQDNLLCTTPEI